MFGFFGEGIEVLAVLARYVIQRFISPFLICISVGLPRTKISQLLVAWRIH